MNHSFYHQAALMWAGIVAVFIVASTPIIALGDRIGILELDLNSYQLHQAIKTAALPDTIEVRFFTLAELNADAKAKVYLRSCDVILVNTMMRELPDFLVNEGLMNGPKVYALNPAGDVEDLEKKGVVFDRDILEYYHHLTVPNIANLIRLTAKRHLSADVDVGPLEVFPEACFYHPDAPVKYETFVDYRDWCGQRDGFKTQNPWIGIMCYGSTLKEGQVEAADTLIRRLEEAGFNVAACFGPVRKVLKEQLKLIDGKSPVEVILAFTMKFVSGINDETRDALIALNVPVFNVIRPFSQTTDEWRRSKVGMGPMETVWAMATPEFSSAIEPTVLIGKREVYDQGRQLYVHDVVDETLELLIRRLKKWVALQRKANAEKKVAIFYYNHSQGKQNIAAAYLNVFRSLEVILSRMKQEGYTITGREGLTEERLQQMILEGGRNIGSWAPGELDALIAAGGDVEQIPLDDYKIWFDRLPEAFRKPVLDQWGAPEDCAIMTKNGRMVFPMVKLGNVVLLPEPARGWSDDPMKLYHDTTLFPHHQYIAAYLWLSEKFGADAMVHLGTHATYEWLPGKQAGLAPWDPPEIMTGDIPNIYPYIVDDIGEGIEAKRRGRGVILDHLTPPMKEADLYHEYRVLHDIFHKCEIAAANGSETAEAYAMQMRKIVDRMGLARDLGIVLDDSDSLSPEAMEEIHLYLHEIDTNSLPYGLHTYGKPYTPDAAADTLHLIMNQNPTADRKKVEKDLFGSAQREMDKFIRALDGEYVPAGEGNDPLRNLAAIPTGKNFYGFSPAKVPSKAAWEIGKRAARQIIDARLKKDGTFPQKVGIVLWATETTRNEGVNESTVLYLIGAEPVWDATERVTGSRVIPGKELGRPRIDVLINPSGLYRDMFPNKLVFLDEAVQKAMVQTDIENLLARNQQQIKSALLAAGVSEEDAEQQSRFRIFTEDPGSYGNGVAEMIGASPLWESDKAVSNVYLNRTQFAVGQGQWAVPVRAAFSENLRSVDVAVHSRSTNVIGIIDTDDFFMYLGGMSLAVKNVKGKAPDTMVTMHRKKDELMVEDVAKTIGRELRTRYLNPQWIEGMKNDNYGGARQMADFVENLWGWQVTVRDAVDGAKWQQVHDVYVEDKYGMALADFFNQHNPWAYQSLTARMLEAVHKDYWQADESVTQKLAVDYAVNVVQKGVACCDHTCNNPMLNQMVVNIISLPGVLSPEMVEKFKLAVENAAAKPLEQQTADRKQLLADLAAAPGTATSESAYSKDSGRADQPSQPDTSKAESDAQDVEGYKMEDVKRQDQTTELTSSGVQWIASLFVLLVLGLFFMGLRRKNRSR